MSGFTKSLKKKAGRLADKLLPSSRAASSSPTSALAPAPSNPDPDFDPASLPPVSDKHAYANPRAPPSAVATVGSAAFELLAAARDGSDLCLPLKAALVGVVKIWDICERTAQVKEEYEKLNSRLAHLLAVTLAYGKRNQLDANLNLRLINISNSFVLLTTCVESKLERGTTKRVLESSADIAEVKDLLVKISARIEAFIYESMIRVEIGVDAILSRLPTAEERELEAEMARWTATVQVITSTLGGRRVHEAAHDTQPKDAGCMPGTRVAVLEKFVTWIKQDPKGIFWLAGLAGTGKTSIAVSLCRMLERDPEVLLGGAFFCSRTTNAEGRTDARRILPSIAVLLANQSPKFATRLAAELKLDAGAAAHRSASDQIGPLLQQPLSALTEETRPIVFVIDALDECSNERELNELLTAIARFNCDARVKFILTSRPETHILGNYISDRSQNEILQLHMLDMVEVTEDIYLYIANAFSNAPLAKPWYTETDVSTLSKLSSGLFIFASTMVSYVLDAKSVHNRTTRLRTALAAVGQSAVAMGPLDAVYEFVITRASDAAKVEPSELEATRRVLACILAARLTLSVKSLSELLGVDADFLHESLQRLQSVLHVPDDDNRPGLRTLHASFGDYLFGRAPHKIRIAESLGHEVLAHGCLNRMAWEDFCFNVSRSRSSYEENDSTTADQIAPSLVYACLHWAHHLAATCDTSAFTEAMQNVFLKKFLFWLEVLSLVGMVGLASGLLRIAEAAVNQDFILRFLRDANTFVASSREAIERSAPHIYLSALPFAAKHTLIYQIFAPMFAGLVSIETFGIDRHSGQLVMTLTSRPEASVMSVAYSSDGLVLASGSIDGTVRIWEMHTGEELTSLWGGTGTEVIAPRSSDVNDLSIWSMAFAPNGKALALGTIGSVCIWAGLADQPTALHLNDHYGIVSALEFSPDGCILASACEDTIVRLWKVETGQNHAVLWGHAETVDAISFSPDGKTLASGSRDHSIRLWAPSASDSIARVLLGHERAVVNVCFSPDGTLLASSSANGTVILWNPKIGSIINILRGQPGIIYSVRFSQDMRSLVTASGDGSVHLWSLALDTAEAASSELVGHTGRFSLGSLSPDGRYIATAGPFGPIQIWDVGVSIGQRDIRPIRAPACGMNSVVVSEDGSFIVSDHGNTVSVWNARTGEPRNLPFLGHTDRVYSVAISSDGHLIASASRDRTVWLWDAHTGTAVGGPLQGHRDAVVAVTFSSNVESLASGSADGTVRLWTIATGRAAIVDSLVCDGSVQTVAFSPNDRILAAAGTKGYIHLWNAATCQPTREPLYNQGIVFSIAFSPESTRLVSAGSSEKPISVWDVSTGQRTFWVDNHTRSVKFSRDGQFICATSGGTAVELWDAATGASVATLYGHGTVSSVAFTPDGESIVSCGYDSIRTWNIATACSLASDKRWNDLAVNMTRTGHRAGWLLAEDGQLLLWVPEEYRAYLHVAPCTMMIGPHRVVITFDPNDLPCGENWTACWRKDAQITFPCNM